MQAKDQINLWQDETDRIARIITDEFSGLNASQYNYSLHVRSCSILELIINLISVNEKFIAVLESYVPGNSCIGDQNYSQGWLIKYLLPVFRPKTCRKSSNLIHNYKNPFDVLELQQQKLKSLLNRCIYFDMNRKIVPIGLFGIIRISLGNYFEYMFAFQRRQIIMARAILMVQ
jgi:hypothetical protein